MIWRSKEFHPQEARYGVVMSGFHQDIHADAGSPRKDGKGPPQEGRFRFDNPQGCGL